METQSGSKSSISVRKRRISRHRIQTPAAETLSEEIIEEILLRLPVKSLLKFRCVSKSWRSLISSNRFIKAHLKISSKETNFTRQLIISTYSSKQFSLHSLFCGLETNAVEVDFPIKKPNNTVRTAGSCNGLVCVVVNGKHIYLLNPSTGKYKKLPDVDDRMKKGLFIVKYGFGFDESNDDYKVFANSCDEGGYESMVYSLRTNSWKRIDGVRLLGFKGTLVNGKLHWGRTYGPDDSRWDIVFFDLASEMFGNVAPPDDVDCNFGPSVVVLGGCLCVYYNNRKTGMDLWVMKEYGVRESWTKMATIPFHEKPQNSRPVCIGPKGDILLSFVSYLMIYSPKDNRYRRPDIRNFHGFLEADVYCESLVPLV